MKIKRKNGLNNCLYLSYFNKYYGLSIVLLNTFVLFLVYDESNLDYKMYISICVIIILNLLIIYFSFIFHIKVDFDKYKMLIREKLFFHIREIDLSLVYNIEFMNDKIIINGEYGVIYETESKFIDSEMLYDSIDNLLELKDNNNVNYEIAGSNQN